MDNNLLLYNIGTLITGKELPKKKMKHLWKILKF